MLTYEIKIADGHCVVEFSNGYTTSLLNVSEFDVADKIIKDNLNMYETIANNQKNETLRYERAKQFAKYDKYQLLLVWEGLTQEQRDEYVEWRTAWLNVTETSVEPKILKWFD